ncbi:MAG: oligosaccharide flippase family protein [Deltaproteobacteria bacterium]|nr:oligosaccharide flippase family protein [Deltaproteobacteria bacterium]
MSAGAPSPTEQERDARDLRRGTRINLLGYALRLLYPLLTGVVVVLYGRHEFGLFVTAQAALLVTLRVCLAGLDKAVLWWVPRQPEGEERRGLAGALLWVLCGSTLAAAAVAAFGAPWLAAWSGDPAAAAPLRWMALGLVPMALMELLVHACLGRRRLEAQVFVKEGLGAVALPAAGALLYLAGVREGGLAWGFVFANVAALAGAAWLFRRSFPAAAPADAGWSVPRPLVRYALPMGLMELLNSALLRLDVLVVAALTDPGTVGVWGVVVQLGNAVRSVRAAFDPLVLAIVSQIHVRPDAARLRAAFSRATALVLATQAPIYAFLIAFVPWLLPLLGEGYDAAATPVLVLCAFWVLHGAFGLHGLIVLGYGRSGLAAANVGATLGAEALLLLLLVPPFGLVGAALAVGLAFTMQNALWTLQSRRLTGDWPYEPALRPLLLALAAAAGAMALAWLVAWPAGEATARVGAFGAFLLTAVVGWLRLRQEAPHHALL